jgi:PAS domain S-box-containing protein
MAVTPEMNRLAAEEALNQHRTLFEEIYDQAPDAMILVDENGRIARTNAQAEALFGLSRERMIGNLIEMLVPERFRERHSALRADYIQHPKLRPMGTELPLAGRRGDGSEFPADIMLSPIEIRQRLVVLAVVRDITERQRTEAHLQMLTREANHRTKNVLGVVQAMVRLTKASSYEEFITRFSQRIQGLSASHDLLVKSTWKNIPLAELVGSQLAHLGDLLESRITASGPDLSISAAAAQAIGLAVHELATNACKYGALSTDAGRVDIHWQVDGDVFTMNWIERGGPPVKPPEARGFGTMVTDSMVKQTLCGDVHLDFAPAGLAWRVICPAANVLESATEHA